MAEDFTDPRDVPWHPRRRHTLYGHEAAEARLLQASRSGKLHHAWLICGNAGIGKATLAYRFARFLSQPPGELETGSLNVAAGTPASRFLSAGAHPNIFVLERSIDQKIKRLKTEIAVDDAREAIEFVSRTSATGGWRIVIVDPADELNGSSANSLLKAIEEPPQRSIFLLVCHQPGRLLRTILSRCIQLNLHPLTAQDTLRVLHELPIEATGTVESSICQAAELSAGSPGRALSLIGSKAAEAFADFLARAKLSPAACIEIGARFTARDRAEDYAVFCELLVGWIAGKAREAGLAGKGAALATAHDDINYSLRQTDALNLDRRQTVVDALLLLDEALKAS